MEFSIRNSRKIFHRPRVTVTQEEWNSSIEKWDKIVLVHTKKLWELITNNSKCSNNFERTTGNNGKSIIGALCNSCTGEVDKFH